MIVIAHNIRSLYNVGSIFRNAAAFGVEKLYLTGITATPPRREIAKVALGAEDLVDFYFKARGEGFGDEIKRRIMIGTYVLSAGYYDAYYKKAQRVRTLIIEDFKKAFEQVDVLLTPVAPTPAFKVGELSDDPLAMYMADALTIPASAAGIPGISCPFGKSSTGLPIGVQVLAPQFEEGRCLVVADALK